MKTHEFIIEDYLDVVTATLLLLEHKAELPTQRTEQAINWQKGIIKELEEALTAFDLEYMEYFNAWQN